MCAGTHKNRSNTKLKSETQSSSCVSPGENVGEIQHLYGVHTDGTKITNLGSTNSRYSGFSSQPQQFTWWVKEHLLHIMPRYLRSRFILFALLSVLVSNAFEDEKESGEKGVTYDARSLFINGRRELLFSGSIHYTRAPPEMWPDIISKAKYGGLDVIQTYVFWNVHEPLQGQYNFTGNYDLVKFIKLIEKNKMYVNLRLGPFIKAEWNHGGLPYWLREVPGIFFRTNNEPFKKLMKAFVEMIVNMMKKEKLFASQGGPIILAQIENEYNHVQRAYREGGDKYVQWAAKLAHSQNTGVPWIMCKQKEAPDTVISTCNGRHCGDTFSGPNGKDKPLLWTENWTAQYRSFGDVPSQRAAEDIAFSIARFFSKDGALSNYYMYYGGTNFGRTTSAFSTTRYYDEAPLDEYGMQREPKWSHLRDVHRAINLSKKPMLRGTPSVQRLTQYIEVRVYEDKKQKLCAAFLTNNHSNTAATMKFRGQAYYLPPRSISILPDCKTVVFNTQSVVSQHSARNFQKANAVGPLEWKKHSEPIPTTKQTPIDSKVPLELYGLLKDTTDYAWFTTSLVLGPRDMPMKDAIRPVLAVKSEGHSLLAFVNGEYIGSEHGSHEEKRFTLKKAANFKVGLNHITLLGATVGLPDSGAYMEHRYAGPSSITIMGLNTGNIDLSRYGWGHQVGLSGEKLRLFTKDGSKKVEWSKVQGVAPALTWFKTKFNTPEGNQPVAIRMTGMGKGMVWVNGRSIGRHWMNFLTSLGKSSQSEYHIPRSFLNPEENLLVVLEEEPSNPEKIEILVVDRDTICSQVSENSPPNVNEFERKQDKLRYIGNSTKPLSVLTCPPSKQIVAVEFASFGNANGLCGKFVLGTCNAPTSKKVVEKFCMGKSSCAIPVERDLFKKNGQDCTDVNSLSVQVKCSE